VVRKLPGRYEDWLISMISSQLSQETPGFDEIISPNDPDFKNSGLKLTSLIRISRLAVVNADILLGNIGRIDDIRLARIRQKLSQWIQSK
jgi:mRNA interferase MazF